MFEPWTKDAGCLGAPPSRMKGDDKHNWNMLSREDAIGALNLFYDWMELEPFDRALFVYRCSRCGSCRITTNGPGVRRRYPPDFEMVVRLGRPGDPVPTKDFPSGFKD